MTTHTKLPEIENLTGTTLLLHETPDGPLTIPPGGSVEVSRVDDGLRRLERRQPPIIKVHVSRSGAKKAAKDREAKAAAAGQTRLDPDDGDAAGDTEASDAEAEPVAGSASGETDGS